MSPVASPFLRVVALLALLMSAVSAFGQIVINEIYYDPPDNTRLTEFVELHNPGATAVSVAGWRIEDGKGT